MDSTKYSKLSRVNDGVGGARDSSDFVLVEEDEVFLFVSVGLLPLFDPGLLPLFDPGLLPREVARFFVDDDDVFLFVGVGLLPFWGVLFRGVLARFFEGIFSQTQPSNTTTCNKIRASLVTRPFDASFIPSKNPGRTPCTDPRTIHDLAFGSSYLY